MLLDFNIFVRTVFPACAGMFLLVPSIVPAICGFPRVRGDVPLLKRCYLRLSEFSPRARGCSAWGHRRYAALAVFPACAGMFL